MDKVNQVLELSADIRYVAIYENKILTKGSSAGLANNSSDESDTYEELLVNPTLLKLLGQRGDIDCGGLVYVIIRYGNFYQLVMDIGNGHISVAVDKEADPIEVQEMIERKIQTWKKL